MQLNGGALAQRGMHALAARSGGRERVCARRGALASEDGAALVVDGPARHALVRSAGAGSSERRADALERMEDMEGWRKRC